MIQLFTKAIKFAITLISGRKVIGKSGSKNKFNGCVELEEEYGVNLYSTFYRQYDPQIGRFGGVDILSEQSAGVSGYQFGINNPISFNDPWGDKYAYMDRNGNKWHGQDPLKGTGGEGIQYHEGWGFDGFGDMSDGGGGGGGGGHISYISATTHNGVAGYVISYGLAGTPAHDHTLQGVNIAMRFVAGFENNSNRVDPWRPDGDRYLTYGEANYWRLYGNGQSLYVDLNKLDFPKSITVERFNKSPLIIQGYKAIVANFAGKDFVNPTQALVYGSLTLVLVGDKSVMVSRPDTYNFDLKLNGESFGRDVATMLGGLAADFARPGGNSYLIWVSGEKEIPLK